MEVKPCLVYNLCYIGSVVSHNEASFSCANRIALFIVVCNVNINALYMQVCLCAHGGARTYTNNDILPLHNHAFFNEKVKLCDLVTSL